MRSQLEARVSEFLRKRGVAFSYETEKLPYIIECDYIPDFILENGIYLETKGLLTYEDRRKMLAVQRKHPEKDIRFVFMRPNNTISTQSKTTYAMWAEKNGFPWCHYQSIPTSWLNATPTTPDPSLSDTNTAPLETRRADSSPTRETSSTSATSSTSTPPQESGVK